MNIAGVYSTSTAYTAPVVSTGASASQSTSTSSTSPTFESVLQGSVQTTSLENPTVVTVDDTPTGTGGSTSLEVGVPVSVVSTPLIETQTPVTVTTTPVVETQTAAASQSAAQTTSLENPTVVTVDDTPTGTGGSTSLEADPLLTMPTYAELLRMGGFAQLLLTTATNAYNTQAYLLSDLSSSGQSTSKD